MANTEYSLKVSVEQTPTKIKKGVSESIISGADRITITHLPGTRIKDTTSAVKLLISRDKVHPTNIVPHIGARNVNSKGELTRQIHNLADMGVNKVLIVGGSSPHPVGPYLKDDELLRFFKNKGFTVGCGVYPYEQGPGFYTNSDKLTRYDFGVSQLCLSPRLLRPLPQNVWVGAPSQATLSGLWGYMKKVGVGPSLSYPLRDLLGFVRFSGLSGFRTGSFIKTLYPDHHQYHLYDFGRIEKTVEELISTDW